MTVSELIPPSIHGKAIKSQARALLDRITESKPRHARWLNTLAFLEHIGSRKILKSQDSARINYMVLQHISEEARHAMFFKKLALQVSPEHCPTFEESYLLGGKLAEDYFQNIDHKAQEDLQQTSLSPGKVREGSPSPASDLNILLNYLYTTWMIENRALMVYQIYNEILKSKKFQFNLNFVLQEENHHLREVTLVIQKKDPDFKNRVSRLFQYEEDQFMKLMNHWTGNH